MFWFSKPNCFVASHQQALCDKGSVRKPACDMLRFHGGSSSQFDSVGVSVLAIFIQIVALMEALWFHGFGICEYVSSSLCVFVMPYIVNLLYNT